MGTLEKCRSAFAETEVDDEIVIICLDTGRFFSLSGTARAVWQMMEPDASREQILAELSQRYEVAPAILARDVDAFVAEAVAAGLIREMRG